MASNIKGITVQIGGETTALNDSLKGTVQVSKSLQSELTQVNKLLKYDPENVVLLTQKQSILSEQIANTKTKLEQLESVQGQVEEQAKKGDIGTDEYRAFQREIESTRSYLTNLEGNLEDTQSAFDDASSSTGKLDENMEDAEKSVDDFNDEVEESGKTSDEASEKLESFSGVAKKVGTAVAASFAAIATGTVAAGKAIWDMANDTAEAGDEIDKNAQKIGISSTAYQEWDYVFERCGTDISTLQSGMKTLSGVITDAANGSDTAAAKLEAVGLSIDDLNGLSQEDQLNVVISSLQNMESSSERTSAATDLLGKSATDLGAVLNMTSDETDALKQEAEDYGMVMSEDAVSASASFEDSLSKLQGTASGLKNKLLGEMLPALTSITDGLSDLMAGNDEAGDEIKNGVISLIDSVSTMLPQMLDLITILIDAVLESAPQIITALATGIMEAIPELLPIVTELILQLTTTFIELLPQIIELGIQLITSLIQGIGQALPELIPAAIQAVLTIVQGLIDNIPTIISAAIQLINGLVTGIINAIPVITEALPQVIDSIINGLLTSIPLIIAAGIQLLTSLIDALPDIITTIVEALPDIIDGIIDGLLDALPLIVNAGFDLLTALINALPEIILTIVEALPDIIDGIVGGLLDALPELIETGVKLFVAIIQNIDQIIAGIVKEIPEIITGIVNAFGSLWDKMAEIGGDILSGLWQGICDSADWLWEQLSGFCSEIWGNIKDFFGIHSPSKLFRDELGKNLMLGWGIGIETNADEVTDAIQGVSNDVMSIPNDVVGSLSYDTGPIDNFNVGASQLASLNNFTAASSQSNTSDRTNAPVIEIKFGDVSINNDSDIDTLARRVSQSIASTLQTAGKTWG